MLSKTYDDKVVRLWGYEWNSIIYRHIYCVETSYSWRIRNFHISKNVRNLPPTVYQAQIGNILLIPLFRQISCTYNLTESAIDYVVHVTCVYCIEHNELTSLQYISWKYRHLSHISEVRIMLIQKKPYIGYCLYIFFGYEFTHWAEMGWLWSLGYMRNNQ